MTGRQVNRHCIILCIDSLGCVEGCWLGELDQDVLEYKMYFTIFRFITDKLWIMYLPDENIKIQIFQHM